MSNTTAGNVPSGPLSGVRVLDLTSELGRYAGKLLAEYGADVLRTSPGERGPEMDGAPQAAKRNGLLQWWHDTNCRRIDLDLDTPDGRMAFEQLVANADVLLEAEGAAAMANRGLSPEALAALNPALVHVALSPQGADGPRANWRSSDLVAQALGGYLSVTGDPDRPIALWGRQAATVGGLYAAVSALAGIHRRRNTGHGSSVDLSLHEAIVSCSEHLMMYWWFAEALAPLGAPIAPRQRSLHWIRAFEVVPCARGACMVSPAAGGLLGLIAWLKERGHAMSIPDEPNDEELLSLVEPMMDALRAVALETDATELFEAGQSLHVPFGESYTISQVVNSPQHRHRNFFRTVEPGIETPGPLARFSATPVPAVAAPVDESIESAVASWPAPRDREDRAEDGGGLPLAGVRVLDLTHVLAGPFATRVFADLGADVVRLQTAERTGGSGANEYPYNVMWGRSKRSIQLHMGHDQAIDVLAKLVAQADVVVDNFSAGVMDGWGAGPDQLKAWNPRVISLSMSGCGTDGPWKDYVTYAPTVHALCGFTALTGPEGETDCGPGIAFNDHISGLNGAVALLAALEARNHTGEGQHIEISQYEVGTYLVGPAIIDHLATGREAVANGNRDPFADHVVNEVFRCADDEWVAVTLFDSDDWTAARALGIGADTAVEDGAGGNKPEAAVRSWAAARTAAEAEETLQAAGLAAGVVQNAGHFVNHDPQLAHRDWLVEMDSPMIGSQTTERHPARWYSQGTELAIGYRPTPYLGEHNFEVYQDVLGWDTEEIAVAIGTELLL